MIRRALALRARRPAPFAGAYKKPLPGGDRLCAFTRGSHEILAVTALREDITGATFTLPAEAHRQVDRIVFADAGATRRLEARRRDPLRQVRFGE